MALINSKGGMVVLDKNHEELQKNPSAVLLELGRALMRMSICVVLITSGRQR